MAETATALFFDLDNTEEIASLIGISLSQEEVSDLKQGKTISLLTHSFKEFGTMLLSIADIHGDISLGELKDLSASTGGGGCRGLKIADVGGNCGLYYVFPIGLERCCE